MPRNNTPPEQDAPLEDDESGALSDLAQLAADLGRAASESEEERRIADEVFNRINRLSKDAQKRLFTRPAIRNLLEVASDRDAPASPDDPPGTVLYRTIQGERIAWAKKPWSWPEAWKMPTKTWTPEARMDLGWQGLLVTVFRRREVTLPEVFYGVYQDKLKFEEQAEEHAAWLMKKRDTVSDPTILTLQGARSRSIANHDGKLNLHVPGGGAVGERGPGDYDYEAGA